MKKSTLLASIFFAALLFAAACTPDAGDPDSSTVAAPDLSSSDLEPPNKIPGVSMTTEHDRYPVGTEKILVLFTNETTEDYYYGKAFRVDRKMQSGWEEVPFAEDMAFIEIALLIPPQGQAEEPVDLTLFEEELSPGTYRVVKHVLNVPFYAEFQIE